METRNLIVVSLISVLFIVTIFISGCSQEDLQKYMDMGKDKLDDFTSDDDSDDSSEDKSSEEVINCFQYCNSNYDALGDVYFKNCEDYIEWFRSYSGRELSEEEIQERIEDCEKHNDIIKSESYCGYAGSPSQGYEGICAYDNKVINKLCNDLEDMELYQTSCICKKVESCGSGATKEEAKENCETKCTANGCTE